MLSVLTLRWIQILNRNDVTDCVDNTFTCLSVLISPFPSELLSSVGIVKYMPTPHNLTAPTTPGPGAGGGGGQQY